MNPQAMAAYRTAARLFPGLAAPWQPPCQRHNNEVSYILVRRRWRRTGRRRACSRGWRRPWRGWAPSTPASTTCRSPSTCSPPPPGAHSYLPEVCAQLGRSEVPGHGVYAPQQHAARRAHVRRRDQVTQRHMAPKQGLTNLEDYMTTVACGPVCPVASKVVKSTED